MPNLMERKSTRRVENGAAQPTSVSNKSVNWRKISIALKMRCLGEEKAQSCANDSMTMSAPTPE
jgi:hypothetical protein